MKILPCDRCGTAKLAKGQLYWAGRYPGRPGQPLKYRCRGCGKAMEMTPESFGRLPNATREQLEAGGALRQLARSLVGGSGRLADQAEDLIVAGVGAGTIKSLAIDQKAERD